jgi:hypothetical protein
VDPTKPKPGPGPGQAGASNGAHKEVHFVKRVLVAGGVVYLVLLNSDEGDCRRRRLCEERKEECSSISVG